MLFRIHAHLLDKILATDLKEKTPLLIPGEGAKNLHSPFLIQICGVGTEDCVKLSSHKSVGTNNYFAYSCVHVGQETKMSIQPQHFTSPDYIVRLNMTRTTHTETLLSH